MVWGDTPQQSEGVVVFVRYTLIQNISFVLSWYLKKKKKKVRVLTEMYKYESDFKYMKQFKLFWNGLLAINKGWEAD